MVKWSHSAAGFTLLELLVVISIIGILIAMGSVAFSTAQKRSRDARRRADVQAAQKGFEQYYAENTAYDTCNTMADPVYLPGGLPVDPQSDNPYTCDADDDSYCMCALLEGAGSGNASDDACTMGSGGDYFCATNLQ